MSLDTKVELGSGHIVLDGDPATAPKGHSSQFSRLYVCCGQTVGWIKMSLGTEVGLMSEACFIVSGTCIQTILDNPTALSLIHRDSDSSHSSSTRINVSSALEVYTIMQ